MSEKIKEAAERYEAMMRMSARELLKAVSSVYGVPRYVAEPGASWWARLKVRYKNWRLSRTEKACMSANPEPPGNTQ